MPGLLSEGLTVEGVDLNDHKRFAIETRAPLDSLPALRNSPITVPYRHGGWMPQRLWNEVGYFGFRVYVLPRDENGVVPAMSTPAEQLHANKQLLKEIVRGDAPRDVRRIRPDETSLQAMAYLLEPLQFEQVGESDLDESVPMTWANPEGTWRILPQRTVAGPISSSPYTLTSNGTADVIDLTITITMTATLSDFTLSVGDVTFSFPDELSSGNTVIIDNYNRKVSLNGSRAGGIMRRNRAAWAVPGPGDTSITWDDTKATLALSWYDRE